MTATNSKPYPCPDWRAEGAIVKSISHGKWSTVVRVDSKLFTQEGREGTAERIVACVNACADFTNEALDTDGVFSALEVVRQREQIKTLHSLLTAIVNGIDFEDGAGDGIDHSALLMQARAALAATEAK